MRAIRRAIARKSGKKDVSGLLEVTLEEDEMELEEPDSNVTAEVDSQPSTSSSAAVLQTSGAGANTINDKEGDKGASVDEGASTSTSVPQFPVPDFCASTSILQLSSPEASNATPQAPSTSSSNTQVPPPQVPAVQAPQLFESHMYIAETPLSFGADQVSGKKDEVSETQTNNMSSDIISDPKENAGRAKHAGVKIKPLNTLQSCERASEPVNKESETSKIDANVRKLESAIQRLESVSTKLAAVARVDKYEQFGKYISAVLRGLPAKKVHLLKNKIMSDIMQALNPEENTAKSFDQDAQHRGSDSSDQRVFVVDNSQSLNPIDPKTAVGTPVGGNLMIYPRMNPTIVPQVSAAPLTLLTSIGPMACTPSSNALPVLQPMACAPSSNTLPVLQPDSGFVSSAQNQIPTCYIVTSTQSEVPRTILPQPTEDSAKDEQTMPLQPGSQIKSCQGGTPSSLQSSPVQGQKRKGDIITYSNKKRITTPAPLSSETTTDDSTSEDQLGLSGSQERIDSQQEFEIDIEEGNELADMKQDEDQFESYLCEGSSGQYIKEEPPETEHASSSAASATPDLFCPLCSEKCASKDHLHTHLSSAHPGYNTLESGYCGT